MGSGEPMTERMVEYDPKTVWSWLWACTWLACARRGILDKYDIPYTGEPEAVNGK